MVATSNELVMTNFLEQVSEYSSYHYRIMTAALPHSSFLTSMRDCNVLMHNIEPFKSEKPIFARLYDGFFLLYYTVQMLRFRLRVYAPRTSGCTAALASGTSLSELSDSFFRQHPNRSD